MRNGYFYWSDMSGRIADSAFQDSTVLHGTLLAPLAVGPSTFFVVSHLNQQ
jgi:hypothetical protein